MDHALYERVKREAKRRFERWPSAYASAWLTKEYKRRGGTYANRSAGTSGGVGRWMREKWVQVGPALDGKRVACGSQRHDGKACRPLKRLSPKTPPTLSEVVKKHGKRKVRSLARRKSRDMKGRVDWKRGTFRPSR